MSAQTLRFHVGRAVATLLAGFVLALCAAGGHARAQNLVINGGFETPLVAGGAQTKVGGAATLAPWTIGGHSVDHVKDFWQSAEGLQSLDLSGDRPGSISQAVPTVPGTSYLLRFKYSGHPDRGGSFPKMTLRWGASSTEEFVFSGSSTKSNMGWISVERTVQATSTSTVLSFTSEDKNRPYGIALDDVSVTAIVPPISLQTPVLFRAVTTGVTGSFLIGRVDGASNLAIIVRATSADRCSGGVLTAPTVSYAPAAVTTDVAGYFGVQVAGIPSGDFVTVAVTSPTTTGVSNCLVSSGDNDSWPKALSLGAAAQVGASDYVDVPGKSRWYKFDVVPGQRINITLSGLPADYDLGVFKDIGAAFLTQVVPTTTAQLTKLSAEFAPSVFSPSVFSPSVFSPSVFSPDAYAPSVFSPSVFSPSVFSPSVFSPSVFSPSVFSPSVFSPSVFSPSVFSPSVFSPSVFSPSVFSPSVFSPEELALAFSSAQTRSVIGVSATAGTGNEFVVVNSWNNTGSFYIRVAGRAGAFSTDGQFTVNVVKEASTCTGVTPLPTAARAAIPGASYKTVILTDSAKLSQATLGAKLDALKGRPEVAGVVVDVNTDPRVQALRSQADSNPACPFAKNLLAEEIKAIVDSYRANNPLRYVVIAGGDNVIPFFRYPDQSLLGQESGYVPPVGSNTASEASLRGDFVLSQDAYGSGTQVSLRTSDFPVPGLAVGRLIETPAEIAGMIDAYMTADGYMSANGVVSPRSSLVTGYDFLEDAANAVQGEFQRGLAPGALAETLITPNGKSPQDPASWTATQLGEALLGPRRHDLVFLAGHFSANSALAADFTTSLLTTDLAASLADFKNAIVVSAGCHSGYNLLDADGIQFVTVGLDWAQAFARKQATLVAGTGYQYGDTDFLEYSERLYHNFAQQLRAGSGAVAIGEALVKAKRDYLASTPDLRGIHEKALLEATLFGLPMFSVNMPGTRLDLAPAGVAITPVAVPAGPAGPPPAGLGLRIHELAVTDATHPLATNTISLTQLPAGAPVLASWLSGPGNRVVSNPAEPALPLAVVNVTPTDSSLVLRGVGFRGGTFVDSTVVALTGAATTELRGVHVPFVSPVFFPMRTWAVNHWEALAGSGGTSLLVTPVQHRALNIAEGTSTQRRFTNLGLRLYYSGNLSPASLSEAPTLVKVAAALAPGGGIDVTAQVIGDPKAAIHEVWITYTSAGAGAWTSLDLQQSTADSRVWTGRLPTALPDLRFVVQAASGLGLVTLDDNFGAYYAIGGAGTTPTTVALISAPGTAQFGDSPTVTAQLSPALVGKSITIAIGGAARIGITNNLGLVSVNLPAVVVPGNYQLVASFSGDADLMPSAASTPFVVTKAPTSLVSLAKPGLVTLIANIPGHTEPQPLLQESVQFKVFQAGVLKKEVWVITDYLGRAVLPPTGLPAGDYTVTSTFAGNATYAAATTSLPLTIATQTISFPGLPASLTIPGTAMFTVTSTSGQPVSVVVSPDPIDPRPHCTLSLAGNVYTLTSTSVPGTCTLTASAGATVTFASITVTQSVAIKGTQTLTSFTPPTSLLYQQAVTFPSTSDMPPGQAISWTVTGGGPCTFNGNVLTADSGTGSCQVAASALETTLYAAYSATFGPIPLTKKAQTISGLTITPTNPIYSVGGTFTVAATAPGGTVAFSVGPPSVSVCTISANTVTILSAGTCIVVASQSGNANYAAAADVAQSIPIAKALQTITGLTITPASPKFSDRTFTVAATATSGGAVTFTVSPTSVCTISGATVTIVSVGTCTVVANKGGDTNYLPADPVTQPVIIGLGTQTITFAPIADRVRTASPFTVNATASSGLQVTFAAAPAGVCTISDASVTLVAAGLCTITASQSGNTNYDPAPTVQQSFNVIGGAFTLAGSMVQPRSYHTATLLCDQSILIAGGFDAQGRSTATSEIYTFGGTPSPWRTLGNLPSKSAAHAAVLVGITPSNRMNPCIDPATSAVNTRVVVFGGGNSSTDIYHPATGTWSPGGGMSSNRSYHTATRLGDGRVLIVGGADNNGITLATTLLYDPGTGSFSNGPTLALPRERHTATLLSTGEVLIAGGRRKVGNGYLQATDSVLFDPVGTLVSPVTSLEQGRFDHRAVIRADPLFPDSVAMVVGGSDGAQNLSSAEIYVAPLGTDDWITVPGGLTGARREHTATVVGSLVLVTGGRGPTPAEATLATTEMYVGGAFVPFANLATARSAHTATAFTIGSTTRVLIVGGAGSNGKALAGAELYQ